MGKPKLLLPWGKTSVLGHLLHQWKTLKAPQVAVVCSPDVLALTAELDRLHFSEANRILNTAPENGMFSSVQCAALWQGWLPELSHWIITLGDQPHLHDSTMRALLDFGARNPEKICQPMRHGRRKHPVLLPKHFFWELGKSSAGDLKMFLVERARHLSGFEAPDDGLDLDMDTPEDYERVRHLAK